MDNIIQLNVRDEVLAGLEVAVAQAEVRLNEIKTSAEQNNNDTIAAKVRYDNAIKGDKQQLKIIWTNCKNKQAIIKGQLQSQEAVVNSCKADLEEYKARKTQVVTGSKNQEEANAVFENLNIHYVIFDQQWWSVDSSGSRMGVKINKSDVDVIKDLIFYNSGWQIKDTQELKKLAMDSGRMFKHIVRDFYPGERPGIYNQMDDIRKNWLQPIHGVTPHESFRILTLSIAGGRPEYADQLERWVAYRYCHPHDVLIPNIDSCATGGTGRETFFNFLRTIFTDECCGAAGTETFKGTHNGDLFGKMMIKIDEKDARSVPIDMLKELTGANVYRHRSMNQDARQVDRLFSFIMFRNGYTSTATLEGDGPLGVDRRFEPIIARVNLARHVALHYGVIDDINTMLNPEQAAAMGIIVKEWQEQYYKNEERIAEWLGYIIDRHDARNMRELLALHGIYYQEMRQRQQRGVAGFMPKFMKIFTDRSNASRISSVINKSDIHKLYEATDRKCSKDWLINQVKYWLNTHAGWDCDEASGNIYNWAGSPSSEKRHTTYLYNRLEQPAKLIWDLDMFIDKDALDDKGNPVGNKINIHSIRDELN